MTVVEGESFLRPDCSAAAQILNLVQDDSARAVWDDRERVRFSVISLKNADSI